MKTLVYAAKNNDVNILRNSSSGGMFSALTEDFIRHGNAVICVHYNYETDQAEFHLVESLKERDASRGSLYIHDSKIKDIQYVMKKYGEASMISKVRNMIKKSIGGEYAAGGFTEPVPFSSYASRCELRWAA